MNAASVSPLRGCHACKFDGPTRLERLAGDALDDLGIPFGREGTLDGAVDRAPLRYDVFVCPGKEGGTDANGSLLLVEAQGKQHFEPLDFYGGEEAFAVRVLHDEIKRRVAAEAGIPLLYIDDSDDGESARRKVLECLERNDLGWLVGSGRPA